MDDLKDSFMVDRARVLSIVFNSKERAFKCTIKIRNDGAIQLEFHCIKTG